MLAQYNRWMNDNLYSVCSTLSDAERKRDMGAFFHSVHGTLNHVLLADRSWLGRVTRDRSLAQSLAADGTPIAITGRFDQILYDDFEVLRAERTRTDVAIVELVDSFTSQRLNGTVSYRGSGGQRYEHPLWWAMTHLFVHQTHHRGQLTTLLMQLGRDPGVTDLVVMLRGTPEPALEP